MIKSCYIHIPFCNTICSYCDFCKIYKSTNYVGPYLHALDKEIMNNYKGEILDTIYIGGGTPSSLNISELDILFNSINKLNKSKNIEFTFECNIEDINNELMKYLKNKGVNRLSIGIESFNDRILKFLNRKKVDVFNRIDIAKKYFDNINIDLMYAIPNESLKDLENDIDSFIKLDIKHISTYSLILEKHTMLYNKKIKSIDEDIDYEMYNLICEKLRLNGYDHYEVSNFSKMGFESKHNMCYWNNEEYYGFGLGASGYVNNNRYDNTRNIIDYIDGHYIKNSKCLTYNETVENAFILGLRKIAGINIQSFNNKYGFDLRKVEFIEKLIKENKLVCDEYNIRINNQYLYISNYILCDFLGFNYEIEKNKNK